MTKLRCVRSVVGAAIAVALLSITGTMSPAAANGGAEAAAYASSASASWNFLREPKKRRQLLDSATASTPTPSLPRTIESATTESQATNPTTNVSSTSGFMVILQERCSTELTCDNISDMQNLVQSKTYAEFFEEFLSVEDKRVRNFLISGGVFGFVCILMFVVYVLGWNKCCCFADTKFSHKHWYKSVMWTFFWVSANCFLICAMKWEPFWLILVGVFFGALVVAAVIDTVYYLQQKDPSENDWALDSDKKPEEMIVISDRYQDFGFYAFGTVVLGILQLLLIFFYIFGIFTKDMSSTASDDSLLYFISGILVQVAYIVGMDILRKNFERQVFYWNHVSEQLFTKKRVYNWKHNLVDNYDINKKKNEKKWEYNVNRFLCFLVNQVGFLMIALFLPISLAESKDWTDFVSTAVGAYFILQLDDTGEKIVAFLEEDTRLPFDNLKTIKANHDKLVMMDTDKLVLLRDSSTVLLGGLTADDLKKIKDNLDKLVMMNVTLDKLVLLRDSSTVLLDNPPILDQP